MKSNNDKRKKVVTSNVKTEQEKEWYIPPLPKGGIPKYDADSDRHCPRGQMQKFNAEKRNKANQNAEKGKGASDWIKTTLKSKYVDVPLQVNPSFRSKVEQQSTQCSSQEVEIIQKIVIRENMLTELRKLIDNQTEVGSCAREAVELVKAIRFQTIDIVEDVIMWRTTQLAPMPFLYRGANYLIKIATDLDFLDQYDELIERFCFEFKYNPLAYRGGGTIITGPASVLGPSRRNPNRPLTEFFDSKVLIDGIEIFRMKNVETVIQEEFHRLDQNLYLQTSVRGGGGAFQSSMSQGMDSSVLSGGAGEGNQAVNEEAETETEAKSGLLVDYVPSTTAATANSTLSAKSTKKKHVKSREKRLKIEKIDKLTEEANELKAIECHIGDKVNVLVDAHRQLAEKKVSLIAARKEALSIDRQAAAQAMAIEIGVVSSDMQNINAEVKDLQRQAYFLSLERQRKRKLAKHLSDELERERQRVQLEKQLAQDIKDGGILKALAKFKLNSGPVGATQPGNSADNAGSDSDLPLSGLGRAVAGGGDGADVQNEMEELEEDGDNWASDRPIGGYGLDEGGDTGGGSGNYYGVDDGDIENRGQEDVEEGGDDGEEEEKEKEKEGTGRGGVEESQSKKSQGEGFLLIRNGQLVDSGVGDDDDLDQQDDEDGSVGVYSAYQTDISSRINALSAASRYEDDELSDLNAGELPAGSGLDLVKKLRHSQSS